MGCNKGGPASYCKDVCVVGVTQNLMTLSGRSRPRCLLGSTTLVSISWVLWSCSCTRGSPVPSISLERNLPRAPHPTPSVIRRREAPSPAKMIALQFYSMNHGLVVLAGRAPSSEAHIAHHHAMPGRAEQGQVVFAILFFRVPSPLPAGRVTLVSYPFTTRWMGETNS